jgi:hypothetical protein
LEIKSVKTEKMIHGVMGMRLGDDAKVEGMDFTEHSETACSN